MSELLNNRYALGEMIGTGGMADVYIGDDTRLNRKVAIKVLRRDLARDPSFVARFRKEAFAAGGLNHPGIVSVYDSGEDNNSPYIVMELITGESLRQLLQKGLIPQARALEIVEGILQALEYSHKEGIVHRDVKTLIATLRFNLVSSPINTSAIPPVPIISPSAYLPPNN